MGVTHPPMRYHGGKWRIAPWIIQFFPEHRIYCEPFGGGASVLLQKPPAEMEVYNDLDQTVVNLFRVLRDPEKAERLRVMLELTCHSRDEFFYAMDELRHEDDVTRAWAVIVRARQSIGAKPTIEPGGFRTCTPKSKGSYGRTWREFTEGFGEIIDRFRGVVVENLPAEKLIPLQDSPETLFYVDPPYVMDTRSLKHRKVYANEMTDEEHLSLIELLKGVRGFVVLSGYDCELYRSALDGWARYEIGARAQKNMERVEVVWLNEACRAKFQGSLFE